MVLEILRELGIFAIGAIVVGWVTRYAIKQYFDKELNRYQTELEKEKVVFSELHNERAQITAELYRRFVEFEEDMRSLTTPVEWSNEPSKEEKIVKAGESGQEFLNYYIKNKIYFPPEICETVEDIQGEMRGVFHEFSILRPFEGKAGQPPDVDRWLENWKTVTENEVPELKSELEDHFRGLLGVDGND